MHFSFHLHFLIREKQWDYSFETVSRWIPVAFIGIIIRLITVKKNENESNFFLLSFQNNYQKYINRFSLHKTFKLHVLFSPLF